MSVHPVADKIWEIEDARGNWLGRLAIHDAASWEWLDENGDAFAPRSQVALGPWERGIGTDWPSPETLISQAAAIRQSGGAALGAHLGGLPELIPACCQGLPEATERTARLALLFGQVIQEFDDVRLRPPKIAMERLAYQALAALYEAEPAVSERRPALRGALKSAFRVWQATVTNDDRAWFFQDENTQAQHQALVWLEVDADSQHDLDAADPQMSRETAMWNILTTKVGQRHRLRRLFRETADGRDTVRRLAERWFLRRCDLSGAEQLKMALRSLARDGQAGGYLNVKSSGLVAAARASEWLTLGVGLAYVGAWLMSLNRTAGPLGDRPHVPALWLLYVLCGAAPALSWLAGGAPDTSTPRLLAGILVALVGVIMQQQWANLALFAEGQPLLAAALGLIIIVAAFRVLLGKVQGAMGVASVLEGRPGGNVIGLARAWWRDPAVQRTRSVWRRGLAAAFLLSLLVSDLLGDIYLKQAPDLQLIRFPGAAGHTYPGLTLLFTALMLFAGVFVQLLWEEKPLTEGIA